MSEFIIAAKMTAIGRSVDIMSTHAISPHVDKTPQKIISLLKKVAHLKLKHHFNIILNFTV